MTWLVALSLLPLGCGGSSSSTGSGTSSAADATSGAPGSTDTDTSGDDADTGAEDGLKYDIGRTDKLDAGTDPPDPFPTDDLGCRGAAIGEPVSPVGQAGAFWDTSGQIRLRLIDDEDSHYWDIPLDIPPTDDLPAPHQGLEFEGYLSYPAEWEWAHGQISGTLDLTVHQADLDGCLVAEITAWNPDYDTAPAPVGWIAIPLQPWPGE